YYVYSGGSARARKVSERLLANGVVEYTEKIYFAGGEVKRVRRDATPLLERWTSHIHDDEGRVALIHRWTRDDGALESDDIARARVHYQLRGHGSGAVLELDEQGGVIAYEEYFPYGGTAFMAGDNERDVALREYRYSAKEQDDFTGLYYFG